MSKEKYLRQQSKNKYQGKNCKAKPPSTKPEVPNWNNRHYSRIEKDLWQNLYKMSQKYGNSYLVHKYSKENHISNIADFLEYQTTIRFSDWDNKLRNTFYCCSCISHHTNSRGPPYDYILMLYIEVVIEKTGG